MKNSPKSRREFLMKTFLGKANQTPDPVPSVKPDEVAPEDKIKMLTADGKLVEVSRNVLNNISQTPRSKNGEILDWIKEGKNNQHKL